MIPLQSKQVALPSSPASTGSAPAGGRAAGETGAAAEELLREMAFVYHLARSLQEQTVEPAAPAGTAAG